MPIDTFLTYIRSELALSAHTVKSYSNDLRQWQEFATNGGREELDPESVSVSDLRLWVAHLSRNGISQRSIKRKISALRSFYNYMMRRHGYKANPASELVFGKTPKSLPSFIPSDEINKVLDEQHNEDDFLTVRNHLIVSMFYNTGMRASELLTLKDRAVDTNRCELKVLGKRNKERIIPFGSELAAEIANYRRLRNELNAESSILSAEFFVTPQSAPMTYSMINRIVRMMLNGRVHSQKVSPHVLRHSFATDMLNNGAQINAVQQLLGHKSLATTQIYTHISISELKSNYQLAHPRALKKGGIHGS